jgi:DNA-binding transcriptional regulator YbjK
MNTGMGALRKSSRERILDAGRDIGIVDGLDASGVRAVARQAEVTPSLVSYHFKGRDALLAALHEHVMAEHYADLSRQLASVAELPDHLRSPASFLTSVISHLVNAQRPLTLLLLELRMHAAMSTDQVNTSPATHFWQEFGAMFDLSDEEIWSWAIVADGALWYAILDEHPVVTQTWVGRAFSRMSTRLAGLPDQPALSPLHEETTEKPIEVAPTTKLHSRSQDVTKAAIRLIARGEKISHRAIAKEAGMPLATTAYFFSSINHILADTYKTIYAMMMGDLGTFSGRSSQGLIRLDGKVAPLPALFGKLILYTAQDKENNILTRRFRDARGLSSLKILRRMGLEVDRLDGLVWTLCHGPYSPMIFGHPASERSARYESNLTQLISRLFGCMLPDGADIRSSINADGTVRPTR